MPGAIAFHSPSEDRFQRIARLAARVAGVADGKVLVLDGLSDGFAARHASQLDGQQHVDAMAERVVTSGMWLVSKGNDDFYVGFPLHAPDGSVVGVLSVGQAGPRTVADGDLALLRDLVAVIEDEFRRMDLSSAQRGLMEELTDARRRALVDPLTHVWNRAGLDELLRREVQLSRTLGRPLSVAMIDLDQFKAVNDTHGHAVGDRVLQAVADRLRLTARPGDSVSRYGGEEFVVVLQGCADSAAVQVAERLRQRVQDEALGMPPGPYLRVTVSIGVASLEEGQSEEDLLRRSDEALYLAKRAGRNCVRAAPTVEAAPAPKSAPSFTP